MEGLFMTMFEEYQQKAVGYRFAIKSKLYEMAMLFMREMPDEQAEARKTIKNNNLRMERVFSFIFGNFDNPELSLEQVAESASLSKFYFTRFFKEQSGQSFHECLSRVRIGQARKFLSQTDLPIIDIAYQCGFASLATFNRLFKDQTGVTPSCYRKGRLFPD
jgi:AraC-like DNA-binding protein